MIGNTFWNIRYFAFRLFSFESRGLSNFVGMRTIAVRWMVNFWEFFEKMTVFRAGWQNKPRPLCLSRRPLGFGRSLQTDSIKLFFENLLNCSITFFTCFKFNNHAFVDDFVQKFYSLEWIIKKLCRIFPRKTAIFSKNSKKINHSSHSNGSHTNKIA